MKNVTDGETIFVIAENIKPARTHATFAPHIPAGVIDVAELKRMLEILEKEGAQKVKLSGEMIFVWDAPERPMDMEEKLGRAGTRFKGGGVRPVRMCSAETFCRRFRQPVLSLAMRIDEMFRDTPLESKVMIGVAGCQRSCSEPATKDIGVIAHPRGYEILAGGNAGLRPKIAQRLTIAADQEEVLSIIGRIIEYIRRRAVKGERLSALIEKHGFDDFATFVL